VKRGVSRVVTLGVPNKETHIYLIILIFSPFLNSNPFRSVLKLKQIPHPPVVFLKTTVLSLKPESGFFQR
jgi:hypothetical protein